MVRAKLVKAKRKVQSTEEKARANLQRRHRKEIRDVFATVGFQRADGASDKEFSFMGFTSDFDDVFILENIVVLAEYTITKESDISGHIKPKSLLYDKILENKSAFIDFAKGGPLNLSVPLGIKYQNQHIEIVILYCSLNTVKGDLKLQIPKVKYLDYSVVRYFKLLTRTVRKSASSEILAFLGVDYNRFADRSLQNQLSAKEPFRGSVLPEAHSNFPHGYKVVSFYIHPAALLSRAYVLRRDGWRDRDGLYQRMILRGKLDSVRKYLIESRRVFVNNIILTLPSGTKVLDSDENTIDPANIQQTQPATIAIPYDFNSIGLIDGQHRVFSYYEGGANESVMSALRSQQNLLVTGIIYPDTATPEDKTRFEAGLFLEINSNQANAKSELKQAINQIIRPFLTDSIAREVLDSLNEGTGVLSDKFARQYFETDVLKTTSVVSYGLRPLVRPTASGPLFNLWTDEAKNTFIAFEDDAARKRYIGFCASQIGVFFSAAKSCLPPAKWTTDKKVTDRLVTPTVVNGLIGAMRQMLEKGSMHDFETLREKFKGLDAFPFENYRSSQYTVMASELFKRFLS